MTVAAFLDKYFWVTLILTGYFLYRAYELRHAGLGFIGNLKENGRFRLRIIGSVVCFILFISIVFAGLDYYY